ncbi:MAG: hypothetical protein AAGC46_14560 [Solirubrobacteraceae bacterium]|nr:hypothetical protein [Patulibacter sp.]
MRSRTRALLSAGLAAAISFVCGAVPAHAAVGFRATSCINTHSASSSTFTVTKPTGTAQGDLMMINLREMSNASAAITAPTGWTALLSYKKSVATYINSISYWKVATASEPTTYSFTIGPGPSNVTGSISSFTGVDTSNPLAGAGAQTTATTGTPAAAVTLPNTTATGAASMRVSMVSSDSSRTNSFSVGTEICDQQGTAGGGETVGSTATVYQAVGAGTTAAGTDTRSGTGFYDAQTYVLNAAPICNTGGLGLTLPGSISFPTTTISGGVQPVATTATLTVDDEVGTGAGWNLTGTSTSLTNGTYTLPTTTTTITGVTPTAASGNCSMPTNSVGFPVTMPAGATAPTAVKLYNASASSGSGPVDLAMALALAVPGNARPGTYTSTWTLTLVSGP